MFWGKSRNIVVALEVGSTKVAAAVGEIRPDGTLALLGIVTLCERALWRWTGVAKEL